MVTIVVVCCGLLSAFPPESTDSAPDLAAYEAAYKDAKTKVGRDADAHVRLALWCEAHGLHAERLKHLAIAALIEPGHATARGLMGLVAHAGGWKRPDAVAERVKADAALAATLAEYKARRDRTPSKADDQWKLALWCEQNDLEAEAKAHLMIVTRLDPNHAAARKRLGYKKQEGRWVTSAQLAEEKAEVERQKKADRTWKPRLERLREQLGSKDEAKRIEAERALAGVTDPRAVPSVWAVFGGGSAARQGIAVQVLGQIDGPAASRLLVSLAISSPAAGVRQAATQTLARRDPRDFVGLLVKQLRDPIKYEVRPVGGPGSPGLLFVEGKEFNVRRFHGTPAVHPQAGLPRIFAPSVPFDPLAEQNHFLISQGLWGLNLGDIPAQTIRGIAANPKDAAAQIRQLAQQEEQRRARLLAVRQEQAAIALSLRFDRENWRLGAEELSRRRMENFRQQVEAYPTRVRLYEEEFRNYNFADETARYRGEMFRYLMALATQRDRELGLIRGDIERTTLTAQQRLEEDVRVIELANAEAHRWNGRLLPILEAATGQGFGEDRESWFTWWADQEGLVARRPGGIYKPTVDEVVVQPFQGVAIGLGDPPRPSAPTDRTPIAPPSPALPQPSRSCFGAGTTVRTSTGPMAIEAIRIGEKVLVQDVRTGALSYQPVLAVFRNPPARTLRVSIGAESIVATGIHRFWKAGHGWAMARDLKAGDKIRTLGGAARVTSVESDETQPVFNLEVAEGGSFFVGQQGALVHDNSRVQPTPEPFDAAPDLAAVVPSRLPR